MGCVVLLLCVGLSVVVVGIVCVEDFVVKVGVLDLCWFDGVGCVGELFGCGVVCVGFYG